MKAYQENQLLQSPAGEKLFEFLQHHRQQWNQTALPDLEQFEHELGTAYIDGG